MLLTDAQRELLSSARRATLATVNSSGAPRLVPCVYAFIEHVAEDVARLTLYSALDEKPKTTADPRRLARVRDIVARPSVALLVDRWSEAWDELAWLRLDGQATLIEPGGGDEGERATAISELRRRYPQYAGQQLEDRPLIRIDVERLVGWSAAEPGG